MAVSEAQINEAKSAIIENSSQLNAELRALTIQIRNLLGDAANQLSSSTQGLKESQAIARELRGLAIGIPTLNFNPGSITVSKDRKFKPDMVKKQRIR